MRNMRFYVSHIYKKDNVCVDGLANYGLTLSYVDMFRSNTIPDFIRGSTLEIGWECPILNLSHFEKV